MLTVNIHQAKTHLSHYLAEVERGKTIIVCKRNVPIAEIRPLPARQVAPRPFGLAKDKGVRLPKSFFKPLPADLLAAFRGERG